MQEHNYVVIVNMLLLSTSVFVLLIASALAVPVHDPHVIGGKPADRDRLYQVSLTRNGKHFCGGAMISDNYVVTAAHCVYGVKSKISIKAGSLKRDDGKSYDTDSKSIQILGCYNPKTQECDVAVLKTKDRVKEALQVRLVSEGREPDDGALLTVTGWGVTSSGSGSMASVLQIAKLQKISRSNCRYSYNGINTISENMICAGEEKRNICVGDSGGPLVDTDGRLVGVVSHGVTDASNKHCNPKFPGVFTNVANSQIHQFIEKYAS